MQNRLVENWLTSCKELSFTTPFVQLLITEGYTILRARGGFDEQGKDVVALNPDGEICCFQLKCDNINTAEWNKINGQINDLTQIPPVHSSFKTPPDKWKCYLVTNGSFLNPVQRTIVDYSTRQQAASHMAVETVDKEELVKRFTDGYGSFFPADAQDLNLFLKIYCQHGDNTLNREEFKLFFEKWLGSYTSQSKQKKLEALEAACILCSYLLTNKYTQENYIEIINAWMLVFLTILYFANEWDIAKKHVTVMEDTILGEIEAVFSALIDDIIADTRSFVDGTYGLLSEGLITHKLRCTELMGYISAYLIYCATKAVMPKFSKELAEKLLELSKHKAILGESSTPLLFNYIVFLMGANQTRPASIEIAGLLNGLLTSYADEGSGIPSTYYTSKQSAEWSFSINEDEITESFQNRAYCLWPAILLAARSGQRPLLEHHWLLISHISNQEVIPDNANDLLLWRIGDNGTLLDTFPNATQSWKELVEQSQQNMDEFLPEPLKTRRYLLPFWILAMPHRCNHKTVLSMLPSQ